MFRAALLSCFLQATLSLCAQNPTPTLEASKAQFATADRELNDVWVEAKKKLSETQFNELKSIQRDWVTFREERAEAAGSEGLVKGAKAQNTPAYFAVA